MTAPPDLRDALIACLAERFNRLPEQCGGHADALITRFVMRERRAAAITSAADGDDLRAHTWIGDDCPEGWRRVGSIDVADPADIYTARDRGRRIGDIYNGGSGSVAEPCCADTYVRTKLGEMADDLRWQVEDLQDEAAFQAERFACLLIAFHDAIRRPLGVTPDSGAEFYDPRMADEAEARRAGPEGRGEL